MDFYKHKETVFLVVLMAVFTLVFFLGYSFYKNGRPILNIGFDALVIDWVVMLLSVLAIARIVFLIKDLEIKSSHGS